MSVVYHTYDSRLAISITRFDALRGYDNASGSGVTRIIRVAQHVNKHLDDLSWDAVNQTLGGEANPELHVFFASGLPQRHYRELHKRIHAYDARSSERFRFADFAEGRKRAIFTKHTRRGLQDSLCSKHATV